MKDEDKHITINHYINTVTNYYENYNGGRQELSFEEKTGRLHEALIRIRPMISGHRCWFSICKVLMKLELVGNGDFKNAVKMIKDVLNNPDLKLDYVELQKLNVQSLTKEVGEWKASDSPFGSNTPEHQTIYYSFMGYITM